MCRLKFSFEGYDGMQRSALGLLRYYSYISSSNS